MGDPPIASLQRSLDCPAQARHGGRAIGYQADLSDPAQIEQLIAQVQQDHPHLDGLINNAGVGYVAERRVDGRGLEWVWAINVLAPWQLAQGLAASLAKGPARGW